MLPPELEQAYELVDVLRRTRRASVLAVRARTNGELLVVKIGPPAPRIGDTTLGSLAPLLWGEHATSSLIRHERDVLVTLDGQGAPAVRGFAETPKYEYVLTTIARGAPARSIPLALRREMLGSIAEALRRVLARAHTLGVVHRDIKPEHVFVDIDDQDLGVTIIDWEVAQLGRCRPIGDVGTTAFKGWEITRLRRHREALVGPSADAFALGLTLWSLAVDRVPDITWRGALDPALPRLDALWPDAPLPLIELIAELTRARPDHRLLLTEELPRAPDVAIQAFGDIPERCRTVACWLGDGSREPPALWDRDPSLWLELDLPAFVPTATRRVDPDRIALECEALRRLGRPSEALARTCVHPREPVVWLERIRSLAAMGQLDAAVIDARGLGAFAPTFSEVALIELLELALAGAWSGGGRRDLVALLAAWLAIARPDDRSMLARLVLDTTAATDHLPEDVALARAFALDVEGRLGEAAACVRLACEAHGPPALARRVPWLGTHESDAALVELARAELGDADGALARARERLRAEGPTSDWHHVARLTAAVAPRTLEALWAELSVPRDAPERRRLTRLVILEGEALAADEGGPDSGRLAGDHAGDHWLDARTALNAGDAVAARAAARRAVTLEPRRDAYCRTLAQAEILLRNSTAAVRALGAMRYPIPDDWRLLEGALAWATAPLAHEPTWTKMTEALAPYDLGAAARTAGMLAVLAGRPGPWISRQLQWLLLAGRGEDAGRVARVALGRGLDDGHAARWRTFLASD